MKVSDSGEIVAGGRTSMRWSAMLLLCSVLTVCPLAAGSNATQSGGEAKRSPQSASVLLRARAEWPGFLKAFRLALKNHNLGAVYAMTSPQFKENCLASKGKDIRKKVFSDKSIFDSYFAILTPGSRGDATSKIGSVELDNQGRTPEVSASMACWSLTFRYGVTTGWRLIYHGQPCEGC